MRTHDARVPFHSLRSATITGTMVALAAYAHVLAGGQLPTVGVLLAVLALTGLASTAATRFRLRMPAMTALLGVGQFMLHEAFTVLGGPLPGPAHGGFTHHLVPSVLTPGPLEYVQPAGTDPSSAGLMFTGHALVTLACALLLAKGEDALWSLAGWLRPLFRLPEPATPDAFTAPAAGSWRTDCAPRPRRNLRPNCRRGPPDILVFS